MRAWKSRGGMSSSIVYGRWLAMMQRCYRASCALFPRYGAVGIRVEQSWHEFAQFYEDMGDPPTPSHEIDRRDSTRGYSKDNCRWATRREQLSNRSKTARASVISKYKGVFPTKNGKRWFGRIVSHGRHKYLGTYDTQEQAAIAYDNALKSEYGEFAHTNFKE